jgi:hypothetical protein
MAQRGQPWHETADGRPWQQAAADATSGEAASHNDRPQRPPVWQQEPPPADGPHLCSWRPPVQQPAQQQRTAGASTKAAMNSGDRHRAIADNSGMRSICLCSKAHLPCARHSKRAAQGGKGNARDTASRGAQVRPWSRWAQANTSAGWCEAWDWHLPPRRRGGSVRLGF